MKKTVLIVDDAPFMRAELNDILESNGYRVVGAVNSGRKAVMLFKHLHSIGEPPNVTLMDIAMKDMNGLEALKKIKEIDKDAIVIMCSSVQKKAILMQAIETGAASFIAKPFTEKEVLTRIERVLNKHSS